MATPVFVDTGAHYALADVHDPDHGEAVRLLQHIVRLRYALVTSNFVISEVYTLLLKRVGRDIAIRYVEELYNVPRKLDR
jgi:predicted nucleic acid-binding protein